MLTTLFSPRPMASETESLKSFLSLIERPLYEEFSSLTEEMVSDADDLRLMFGSSLSLRGDGIRP